MAQAATPRTRQGLLQLLGAPVATGLVLWSLARPTSATRLYVALGACGAVLALRLLGRRRSRGLDPSAGRVDFAAALCAGALAPALARVAHGAGLRGVDGLSVLAVALCSALGDKGAALACLVGALGAEIAVGIGGGEALDARALGLRVAVLAAAALLHRALTALELASVRRTAARVLEEQRKRERDEARSFRLVKAPSSEPHAPGAEDDRRLRSSLEEIRETLVGLLEVLRSTLALRTCAVYWLDARNKVLRPVEVLTDDAEELDLTPIATGAGAVGGAAALGRPVVLARLREDYSGLNYYRGPHGVQSFLALPITVGGDVRGVLLADRREARAFTPEEQATLAKAAELAFRHVQNERVFSVMEKSKDELAKLFAASRTLGEALTEEEVVNAVIRCTRSVVEHDLTVLATFDEKTGEHRVRHAEGDGAERLLGHSFRDNAGLASAAVKARQPLPYRGHFDPKAQYVFSKGGEMDGLESVFCVPLVVRDHVVGTLTLGARRRGAFAEATRQLLGVLAGNAAVAMANAAAVRRLEELATTDPMTGHFNKRAFETEFEKRIRAAERFGHQLTVLVSDIDKFKNVNDTYGHSVGDVVIKGLGAVLGRCKRDTDAVARFGGEEFVVVCEQTDSEGGVQLAERIRTELGKTVFQSEQGPLSVTCSVGVATFPKDGRTREELFRRADEALYEAKRGGRNRVCVAGNARTSATPEAPPQPATPATPARSRARKVTTRPAEGEVPGAPRRSVAG